MSNYSRSVRRAPRTLTDDEQKTILKVSGKHRDSYRDHVLISLALGSALRESEIVALNVGDVAEVSRTYKGVVRVEKIRRRIELQVFKGKKGKQRGAVGQEVFLPDATFYKLGQFLKWKKREGQPLEAPAPLFVSQPGNRFAGGRLSTRTVRHLFREWQKKAGFDQLYPFHSLRHSAITNLYRQTGDLRRAQKHARHANISTTTIYEHVSDEELMRAVRRLPG